MAGNLKKKNITGEERNKKWERFTNLISTPSLTIQYGE